MGKFKSIIFWGAVWGVMEATLGWFLHLIHFRGELFLLYPIGLFCMIMAATQTGSSSSVIKVAAVASIIKLVNLFMLPIVPVFHVTNPALAIFLEGLAAWGVYTYVVRRDFRFARVMTLSILMVGATSLLFRGWQQLMHIFVAYNPRMHEPIGITALASMLSYILIQGAMITAAVYLFRDYSLNLKTDRWIQKLALPILLTAIILNLLI